MVDVDIMTDSPSLEKIAQDLAHLIRIIGAEADDGVTGNGLVGRIMRIEKAQIRSDMWINRLIGAATVISACWLVIWWLVKDKVNEFFHTI